MPNLLRKLSHRLSRERSGDQKERHGSPSCGEEGHERRSEPVNDHARLILDPHALEVLEEVVRLKREHAARNSNDSPEVGVSAREPQAEPDLKDMGTQGDGDGQEAGRLESLSDKCAEEEYVHGDSEPFTQQSLDCSEDLSPGSNSAEPGQALEHPGPIDVYIPGRRGTADQRNSNDQERDINGWDSVPEVHHKEEVSCADGAGVVGNSGLPMNQIMALAQSLQLDASESMNFKSRAKRMPGHVKHHNAKKSDRKSEQEDRGQEIQGEAKHFLAIEDDDQVVEGANKALERYFSPEINNDRLRQLMEAEKALERELLGIDQSLIDKLPAKVGQRLSGRARAMAAAETVASGATFEFSDRLAGSSGAQSLGRSTRLDYQLTSENATSLGYAARAKVSKARKSLDFGQESSPSIVQGGRVSPPPPSEESQPEAVEWKPAVRSPEASICRFQQLSSVYDRTFAWKRRSEWKCYQERVKKEVAGLANCTFNPVVNRTTMRKTKNLSSTTQEAPPDGIMDSKQWWDEDEEDNDRDDSGLNDAALTVCSDGSNATVSTQACLRLYAQAQAKYARYHRKVEDAMLAERRSLQALSPKARPLSKTIYGHDQGPRRPKVKPLATGMEECTFHPRTNSQRIFLSSSSPMARETQDLNQNFQSLRSRPASAPPARSIQSWCSQSVNDGALEATFQGVDFDEFLRRQNYYAEEKERKIRASKETSKKATTLSPGTRRILKEKAKRPESASVNHSESSNVQELVQLVAEDLGKLEDDGKQSARSDRTTTTTPKNVLSYFDPECSFSPKITKKAMKMSKRTLAELSAGDTLRREALLEIKRAEKESRQMSEATFKPQLYKGCAYEYVEPKLNMKDPASYLIAVQEKQRQQRKQEKQAQRAKEEAEVRECTFKPRTKALPEYIARMAKEHSKKKQNQRQTELDDPFRRLWFV